MIVTVGVTLLTSLTTGALLLALVWQGLLDGRAWLWLVGAWAASGLASATISYLVGGAIWGPYSWLHRTIEAITRGDFNLPTAPAAREVAPLMRGLRQIADELRHYRGLRIDALILEKDELEAVVNSMTEGLAIYDMQLEPVLVNPALRQMAQPGVEHTAYLDTSTLFLERWVNPAQYDVIEEAMRRAPDQPRTDLVELHRPRQFLKRYSCPLYSKDRRQVGHLVIYHDLTPEIEADRLKSDFIANASHELRTPVASLKVLVESLLDGAQDDPTMRQSFLEDIHNELDRLHALVNDLLDLAALEARHDVRLSELDALHVIDEAFATVAPQAAQREISLELQTVAATVRVCADRSRLRQILVNLLGNAVKFTPQGGKVSLAVEESPEATRFTLRDTGIGIPAQDLPHIFDRFFRVTRGRSRLQGGSGLGLTIVKQAVDAHHGQISVESTEGEGTQFTIVLPRQPLPLKTEA